MENNENVKPSQGLNIAGFIIALFFPIIGLIISIIGLSKSKETGVGRGFSIAGIVIASIKIVLGILLFVMVWLFVSNNLSGVAGNVVNSIECSESYDCVINDEGTYNCKYDSIFKGDNQDIVCTKRQINETNMFGYEGDYSSLKDIIDEKIPDDININFNN